MPLIDNKEQTMEAALKNALSTADRVDVEVGFFYFSGFQLVANELEDKKVRILVGKYIDPTCVPDIAARVKNEGENLDLERFQPRHTITSMTAKKQTYTDGFVRLFNETALFDDSKDQSAYVIFQKKLDDGSLEIKLSDHTEHGKVYIMHNRLDHSQGGDLPGTVIMGSSNFTYQGLKGQGELNDRFSDRDKFEQYTKKFESLWIDAESIDVQTQDGDNEFLETIKKDLWINTVPSPYEVYVRVLHELFNINEDQDIKTPRQIAGANYIDLKYQIDAIRLGIDRINRYRGVIIADVVGLGKSIVAAAVANNLNMRSLIIVPPHLMNQWKDYQLDFRLPGAKVESAGKIAALYEQFNQTPEPLLVILDEAHRYRNEDTNDYKLLHQICRSHPDNKVMLLTATPFNNDPKDVFSLVKLFDAPGQSAIRSVDNLSLRFRELIARYKDLNKYRRKEDAEQTYIDKEAEGIAKELRRLIESIIVRRSRIDLKNRSDYREDLEAQEISFPEIVGPNLMEYNLGDLLGLYLETLDRIVGTEKTESFKGARYRPATYITQDKNREKFIEKYGKYFDESDLKTAQTNLAKFMRRLLVTRFESSKYAFETTLQRMIDSNTRMEAWWNEGKVPILKKGQIPDPSEVEVGSEDAEDFTGDIESLGDSQPLYVESKLFDNDFIVDVRSDIQLLKTVQDAWFNDSHIKTLDPKLDSLEQEIHSLLKQNPDRKIVIFSGYADTVDYLYGQLTNRGNKRLYRYTGAASTEAIKRTLLANFDASLPEDRKANSYDVLIATDALSEGFNLHRAGVVINYDIPYNPTRVIQRIGRINRINKKVFDKIHIYNCFPTVIGEDITRIKQISTLKIRLINSVIGSDTPALTNDEELHSFEQEPAQQIKKEQETETWDTEHQEVYQKAKRDEELMKRVLAIKPRSRVVRKGSGLNLTVAFGKKGDQAIFALAHKNTSPHIVAPEDAVDYFKAKSEDKGEASDHEFDKTFSLVRDTLFAEYPLPPQKGRRADALKVLKLIENSLPKARIYCRDLAHVIKVYDDVSDGTLKDIAQLPVKKLETTFVRLKNLYPPHQIEISNQRAQRVESAHEAIVLSEEHRS